MSEQSFGPDDLNLAFGTELADLAGSFALLERSADGAAIDWLADDDMSSEHSEQYERQLTDARDRFEATVAQALAKAKPDEHGMTRAKPYEALDDDGAKLCVQLLELSTDHFDQPYTFYKVFITRDTVDAEAATRTELRSEFWFVAGSQYNHIPDGLENKTSYRIVRPAAGGEGRLTYLEDDSPELSRLNRLTRLARQSPDFVANQRQSIGRSMLTGAWRRRRKSD